MLIGVGLDLVEIGRFVKMLNKKDERLVERLLTEKERTDFLALEASHRQAEWLAGRFAAKEALMKALGLSLPRGIVMRDIEVSPDSAGRPCLVLSDAVLRQLEAPISCHLSITHTDTTAAAVVVIEKEARP